MSRAKRSLAILGVTALASAGLMTAFAPAASALPTGCTASYNSVAPDKTTVPAGTDNPGATLTLEVTETSIGACGTLSNVVNLITVTATQIDPGTDVSDIILEASTAGASYQQIPLAGTSTGNTGTFTGVWGGTAGFPIMAANNVENTTQFNAPAGKYSVKIQLADVTADGPVPITGADTTMDFTVIAAPTTAAHNADLPVGGTVKPFTATYSGAPGLPQSTFTYTTNGSDLPEGVTFNGATGEFSASAAATPGDTWTGTIIAKDALEQTGESNEFILTITSAAPLAVTADTNMWGVAGKPLTNSSVAASGGMAPYTFSWDLDPAVGLSINPGTGAITGTVGAYAFDEAVTITVKDAAGAAATYTTTMHILGFNAEGPSLSGGIVTCKVGSPFSLTFTPTGLGGHGFAFSSATPVSGSGLTLTVDGKLTGTPTNCDFMSYTYTLTDTEDNRTYSRTFSDPTLDTEVEPVPPTNNGQKPLADSGSTRTVAFLGIGLAALAMGLAAYFISRRLREDLHAIV